MIFTCTKIYMFFFEEFCYRNDSVEFGLANCNHSPSRITVYLQNNINERNGNAGRRRANLETNKIVICKAVKIIKQIESKFASCHFFRDIKLTFDGSQGFTHLIFTFAHRQAFDLINQWGWSGTTFYQKHKMVSLRFYKTSFFHGFLLYFFLFSISLPYIFFARLLEHLNKNYQNLSHCKEKTNKFISICSTQIFQNVGNIKSILIQELLRELLSHVQKATIQVANNNYWEQELIVHPSQYPPPLTLDWFCT